MKYKKIILGVALALACFSSLNANALTETKVKKTETQAAAPNVYWTDGYGRVSYTTNSIISPVVKIALKEFAGDMKAVTGFDAKEKSGAPIQIYQLDQLTNKEFSAVEKLGAPLHLIITAKDAFYIGTRKGQTHRYRKQRPRNGLRHHETLSSWLAFRLWRHGTT